MVQDYISGEKRFFDALYRANRPQVTALATRDVQRASQRKFRALLESIEANSRILEIGCGCGELAIQLAQSAKLVIGLDVSTEGLTRANRLAVQHGTSGNSAFVCMPIEQSAFPADSFDYVVDNEAFSSLDLKLALPEMSRILKKGGRLFAIETFGENPILNFNRRINLYRGTRTRWMVDHILDYSLLETIKTFFKIEQMGFYHVSVLGLAPLVKFLPTKMSSRLLSIGDKIDQKLLAHPFLQRFAFKIVLELSPIKAT